MLVAASLGFVAAADCRAAGQDPASRATDPLDIGAALRESARAHDAAGRHDSAVAYYRDALAAFRAAGALDEVGATLETSGYELRLAGGGGGYETVMFAPGGEEIVTAGYGPLDGFASPVLPVQVWRAAPGLEVRPLEAATTDGTSRPRFSPDGRTLFAIRDVSKDAFSPERELIAWAWPSGELLVRLSLPGLVSGPFGLPADLLISPDGSHVLAVPNGLGPAPLLDVARGAIRHTFGAHGGVVTAAFSADGETLFLAHPDGRVRAWSLDGTPIRELAEGLGAPSRLRLSPDGRILLGGSQGRELTAWSPGSGDVLWTRRMAPPPEDCDRLDAACEWYGIEFTPDGTAIASDGDWGRGYRLSFLSTSTGEFLPVAAPDSLLAPGYAGRGLNLAFSPADDLVATLHSYSSFPWVLVWNSRTGHLENAFSPLTACENFLGCGSAAPLDRNGDIATMPPFTGWSALPPVELQFSPDGSLLLTSVGTGVAIWDPLLGIRLGGIRRPNVFIGEPEVTADGRHVRQGGRLWELATGAPAAWTSPADTIYAVGIAGRSPPAASGSGAIAAETPSGDSIQVIEYGTGRVLLLAPFDVPAANTVTLSDDGSRLATQWTDYSGEDPRNWISVWEVGTGQELTRIPLEDDVSYGMWHLRLSPDGAFLSAAFDDAMQVWEAETGREAGEFDAPGISGPRGRVVFSPGGTYLSYRPAFAGAEDSIWVRRTGTWDVVARFDRAGGIRFSPDERFAFGWDHGRSELIELETGEKRWTGAEIRAVSPDGEMAVVGSELWSLETFTSLATLSDGSYQVWAATFSPDGHLLITAGDDGATRVWDPHGPVGLFRRFATTGGDWAVASDDGLFDGSEIGVRGLYYLRGERAVGLDALGRDLFQPGLSGLLIGEVVGAPREARPGQVGPAPVAESAAAGSRVTALTRTLESARAAGDATTQAEALIGLGTIFLELERPSIALLYLTRARDLSIELSDPDGRSRAEALLGDARLALGQSEAAVGAYRAALDGTAGSDGERRLALTLDLGGALLAAGRSGAALAHMHEAAGGREARGDSAELARAWIEIAGAHRLLGRADSAKAYYRRGATLHRDQGRPEELAAALTDWAELKVETESDVADSLGTAAAFYRYAARVHRESENPEREASALSGLGWTLTRWSVLESSRGASYPAQSLAFAADDTLKRAFSIQIERGDERGLATTVGRLATLMATGQPVSCLLPSPIGCPRDNVLGPHRWATELFRRESDHWGEFNALWNLGRAFESQRNFRGAVASYAAAAEALTGLRLGAGGDADRVSFVERASGLIGSWTDAWRWLALTLGEREATLGLLAASEAGRARALLDLLRAPSARAAGPEEPAVAPSIAAQIATGDSLAHAVARLGVPVLTYSVSSEMVTALLVEADGGVRSFVKGVPRDSLATLVEGLRLRLGVDAASRDVLLADAGSNRTLDPIASEMPEDRLRSEVIGGETRSEEVGSETVGAGEAWREVESALSEILLDPAILDAIPAGGEFVIVPHGSLNLVPFGLLMPPGADRPLGLTHALRYAPSIRAMLASEGSGEVLDPRRLDRERLLVVGDPIMPGVYSSLGERLELDRLPGAAAEAESVSELLGTGYLTDGMASEAAVRRRIAEASLVHLATHGYAYSSEAQARESFVALAPGEGEDGVLTLAEVMAGPDLAAELVVLSACQTGLGNLRQAEGTVGFQRAFLAKKARSVLVSQWNVSDEATRILMERFYAHWTADRDEPGKAEALRRAQLDLFESGYEHPRFWAAFQLVGAR